MKKLLMIILLIATLALSAGVVYGDSEPAITFSKSEVKLTGNQQSFTLDVYLDSEEGVGAMDLGIRLGSDMEPLTKGDIKFNNLISNTLFIEKEGVYYFGFYDEENLFTGKNKICTLSLSYKGSSTSEVELVKTKLGHLNSKGGVESITLDVLPKIVVKKVSGETPTPPTTTPTPTPNPTTQTPTTEEEPQEELTDETLPENLLTVNFMDLHLASWASDYITYIAARGIVEGTSPSTFEPNGVLSREAYIKMLVEAFDLVDEEATCSFTDVDPEEWYAVYIASAEKVGITEGIGNGLFGIGQSITREQMATMTYRALKVMEKELSLPNLKKLFDDNDKIADYAIEAVYQMQRAGILEGMGDNMFVPKNTATRAQAAKIIYMLITMEE